MGTLPFQGHRASLGKEEGTEQQTWFLLGGQCVCLLSQGLDIIEFKAFVHRMTPLRKWKDILQVIYPLRFYMELLQLSDKKTNNPI